MDKHLGQRMAGALTSAARGWHVFPCHAGTKHPRWKWSRDATNDLGILASWWVNNPEDNPAIATRPSHLVVLDLDLRTADDPVPVLGCLFNNGLNALQYLARTVGVTSEYMHTYTVTTPKGGLHLYYEDTAREPVSNRPLMGAAGLLDVRAAGGEFGGYVLAPGAVNKDGECYTVVSDLPVAPLPPWLRRLLTRAEPDQHNQRHGNRFLQPTKADWPALAHAVATSVGGNRNATMFWAATTMFEEGATVDEVQETLVPAFLSTGHHHTEQEAHATIRSAQSTASRKEQ